MNYYIFEVQKTFDDMKSLYLTLNMSLGHIEYEYNRGSCGKLLTFLIIDKPCPTQAWKAQYVCCCVSSTSFLKCIISEKSFVVNVKELRIMLNVPFKRRWSIQIERVFNL